jgi:hypothetical protein
VRYSTQWSNCVQGSSVFVWIRVSESRRPLQQCNKSSHGMPVCCSSKSKTVNREATAVRQQQAKNPTNLAVGIFAMGKDLYSRVAQRSQTDSPKAHEISTCRRPSQPFMQDNSGETLFEIGIGRHRPLRAGFRERSYPTLLDDPERQGPMQSCTLCHLQPFEWSDEDARRAPNDWDVLRASRSDSFCCVLDH